MYNYHFDQQIIQNLFSQQYLQWNPQYFYIPLIHTPLMMEIDNSIHY